jgi:hypothetical protein
MSKYSPGPWRRGGASKFVDEPGNPHFIELSVGTDIWWVDETAEKAPVIQLEDWFSGDDINLIAAAPEMLALLREHAARCLFPSQPCEAWTAKHPEEKTCRPCRVRALLARVDGEP